MPGAEENQPKRDTLETQQQHWEEISTETGKTIADVIRDITNFAPIPADKRT